MLRWYSLLLLLGLFVAACSPPSPPDPSWFTRAERMKSGSIHLTFDHQGNAKNAIFIAADSYIQKEFERTIKEVYQTQEPIRIETIVWWRFAPYFRKMYDHVILIPFEHTRHANVVEALKMMAWQNKDFDIYLLTHGIPGRLTDGDRGYFLSWKELEPFHGRLERLDLVFMQSCYGSSLTEDWFRAGADTVISYPGLNRNFLFVDHYLHYYQKHPDQPVAAYNNAKRTLPSQLSEDRAYKLILDALKLTPSEYMKISPYPEVHTR